MFQFVNYEFIYRHGKLARKNSYYLYMLWSRRSYFRGCPTGNISRSLVHYFLCGCGRAYDSEEAEDVYYDVTNLYYYKDVFYVYIYDYMKSYIFLFCSSTVSAPNLMMDGNILHILQYIAHLQPIIQ
jgi:hypothetical protein